MGRAGVALSHCSPWLLLCWGCGSAPEVRSRRSPPRSSCGGWCGPEKTEVLKRAEASARPGCTSKLHLHLLPFSQQYYWLPPPLAPFSALGLLLPAPLSSRCRRPAVPLPPPAPRPARPPPPPSPPRAPGWREGRPPRAPRRRAAQSILAGGL